MVSTKGELVCSKAENWNATIYKQAFMKKGNNKKASYQMFLFERFYFSLDAHEHFCTNRESH